MLKDRLSPIVFAALSIALLGGMLLGARAPQASAAPLPVLTASAQPPTPTATETQTTATPTETPTTSTPTETPSTATATPTPTTGAEEQPRDRDPDPTVSKRALQDEVSLGGEITYEFTITNVGNATANGVIVEDTLPGYLQLLSASVDKGEAVINGNTVGFWIGDVEPGEVIRGTVTARVVALPPDGIIRNEAVLRSSNAEDKLFNNRSNATVRVRQDAPTPSPTVEGLPSPTPVPPTPLPEETPPASLPVTAGTTSLPLGLLALIALIALGYIGAGVHFWRKPRQ